MCAMLQVARAIVSNRVRACEATAFVVIIATVALACSAERSAGGKVTRFGKVPPGLTASAERSEPRLLQAQEAPPVPRLVAYVNCLCGFGVGTSGGACLAQPDPRMDQVKAWEDGGSSPITHYVIAFLAFKGHRIKTDAAPVWASGGGSTSDFELDDRLRDAMQAAQAHGKKVLLSLGGERGSARFLAWWRGLGASSSQRVQSMRAELQRVARTFAQQNHVVADGFDLDLELEGVYGASSDKYAAIRDLINAVPDDVLVAFSPQVGNGLCAAPVAGDALSPATVFGGPCQQAARGGDTAWVLARLDQDCKKQDGRPKLEYFGIQYYNVEGEQCCGGGNDAASMIRSTAQSYTNLANGWPTASGVAEGEGSALAKTQRWAAFAGIGASRLVLGKPACSGCAESDYLDLSSMQQLVRVLDQRLHEPMGGVMFWDLCRLFGDGAGLCLEGHCQPSWGGDDPLRSLRGLRQAMTALRAR